MEAENSVILESCGEDSMLIQTVKSMVMENTRNELESEERFFVVTDVQGEQQTVMEVTNEECANQSVEKSLWSELCRVCANVNDHLIPIFEGEGLQHELCTKIHKYLPIHVSENDTLPLQLCYHCAATLLAWHELSEGCLGAERRLLEMQNSWEEKQYFNAASCNGLQTTVQHTTTVPNVAESLDEQQDVAKDEASGETAINDSDRFRNIVEARSLSFGEFRKAFLRMRTNRKKNIIKPTNIETPTQFQVNENNESCNVHPLNQSSRNREINEKENKNGDVILLTRSSIVQQQLKKHSSETQNSDVCLKENQNSPYTVKRKKGKLEKDSIVNFIDCKMCSKKFRLQESYRAHMRVHAGEKLFTCHICGKQFSQTGSLYYHLKHVHAGVKNHSCDICGRCFAMKTAMEDHRRIHTDERPYVCDSCGKTFRTKASLYIHNKTHTNDYPHKCSYCAKAFRWKQQMIGHLTIHTGEKNHTCDICGKRFGVKNDLTRHRRTHSVEKPYVCGQCGISFGQKRYLKSHERARHK